MCGVKVYVSLDNTPTAVVAINGPDIKKLITNTILETRDRTWFRIL